MNINIRRALLVALVVGSFLNAVNSYDVFLKSDFTNRNVLRITLTYITPFFVSLYSSIKADKNKSRILTDDYDTGNSNG